MRRAIISKKVIISSKGQLVIPLVIRQEMGIHTHSELWLNLRFDGVAELAPVERSIENFFGRCKGSHEKPLSIAEMDEAIMQAVSVEQRDRKKEGNK